MSKLDKTIALGFHEFFRYAIPGYGLVTIILIVVSLLDPFRISALNLQNVVVGIIAGPFVGFLIYWVYYPIWTWYYSKNSKAYKRIKAIIESIDESKRSKLKSEFEQNDLLLVRCVWDRVYFSDENKAPRERIQFLLTMVHSIGTTIISLWFGFAIGLIYVPFSERSELNLNAGYIINSLSSAITKWYWLILLLALIGISILLFLAFLERKRLAENQEFLLVLENHQKIKNKTSEIAESLNANKSSDNGQKKKK